ncbi:hypothetical protein N9L90_01070 [Planctomycetota bacterium]|jgi:hypothetical protein|nr:hypothetical protein [Planctomycetota bacterium]
MTAPYLAVLALIAPLHGQDVDAITFERAPRQVGEQFTEARFMKSEMEVEVSLGDEVIQQNSRIESRDAELRVEVLELEEGRITKLEIHTVKLVKSGGPTAGAKDVSPLVGLTLHARLVGDGVEITDAQGKPVEQEVAGAAKALAGPLFKPKPRLIPDRPIKIGETLNIDFDQVGALIEPSSEDDTEDFEFTLKLTGTRSLDGTECGVFEAAMSYAAGARSGVVSRHDLKGEVLVDIASGRVRSMTLGGEVEGAGQVRRRSREYTVQVDGAIELELTRSRVMLR